MLLTTQAADAARRPNVLFIAVDDLNTRIGCYGDPVVKTPNLDRLARRGVRFERAYCQFPLCNPSRVSLLLGRYPTTTDSIDFARPALLGRDWVTLTEHFRASGYEVQLRGKVYHYPEPKPWSAGRRGVRKEQEIHRRNMADLTRWEPYRTLAPPPTRLGQDAADLGERLPAGPRVENGSMPSETQGLTVDGRREERPASARNCSSNGRASGKPFFLGVGFYKPHVPLVAPAEVFRSLPGGEDAACPRTSPPRPRPTTRCRAMPCGTTSICSTRSGRPRSGRRAAIAAYYACITFMDENWGKCSTLWSGSACATTR